MSKRKKDCEVHSGTEKSPVRSVSLSWTANETHIFSTITLWLPTGIDFRHSISRLAIYLVYTKFANWLLIIKPTSCTDFSNLFLEWNSTCFGQFLCPPSGVFFYCTRSNGICHAVLQTAYEQDQDGTQEFHPNPARNKVTRAWRKLHNDEINDLYSSPNIVRVIKI